jgi:hypothetical protein
MREALAFTRVKPPQAICYGVSSGQMRGKIPTWLAFFPKLRIATGLPKNLLGSSSTSV